MIIELNETIVDKNRIVYDFTYDEDVAPYINPHVSFFSEYLTDISFYEVPESIINITFVTNVLPLCWAFGATIKVKSLDYDFYQSISKMEEGFKKIYPDIPVRGKVIANEVIKNIYDVEDRSTCLFSGGVDATLTFLRHRDEHPAIINVWGVDVALDDLKGHQEMDAYFQSIADKFYVPYICIKSTLRTFLNEKVLNSEGYKILKDYWWHGAQHSIGLLSLLAPYNYVNHVKTNYIASTFTEKEFVEGVRCISYPVVDNALKMANTTVHHDGYEFERIDKIKYICETCKSINCSIDLKVCFHYHNGKNCSNCEKCFRTMMAILVYDMDVSRYGFDLKDPSALNIKQFLDTNEIGIFRWKPIQDAYISHDSNNNIRWLKKYKFNKIYSFKNRIKRKVLQILK